MKKKALVVLLAVAMIFCFASAAMAVDYSDMGNATKATQDAVSRLSGLGVIDGYTDGTFGPNNNIRRDEFAKIATCAAGFASSADSMKNQATGYTDAAKGIWSTGYINIASAQGYMKGTGNNKFTPAANITNAEVLTTVLRMYGYNDNLTGPWPINYVNQAVKDGITDDVANFSSGATATRGDVAIMVSAALDQTMMEYSKDTESFQPKEYGTASGSGRDIYFQTLFQVAFGGEKVEKALISDVDVASYDEEDGLTYTIQINGVTTTDYTCKGTKIVGADFTNLLGKYATITYDKKNNVQTITVTSKEVKWTEYEPVSGSKVKLDGKNYTLADGANIELDDATDKVTAKTTFANGGYIHNGVAYINPDGKLYYLGTDWNAGDINEYSMDIVYEVNADKKKFDSALNADYDDVKDIAVIKDGKYTNWESLEAGDVLAVYGIGVVVVVDNGTTGVVGSYVYDDVDDFAKVNIGKNQEYLFDAYTTYVERDGNDYADGADDYADLYDKEVTYYTSSYGDVELVVYGKAASTKYYGVVMDGANYKGGAYDSGSYMVSLSIFTAEGKTVNYDLDNTEDGVDKKVYTGATDAIDDEIVVAKGAFVEYTLNDEGAIDGITPQDKTVDSDAAIAAEVTNNKYIEINGTTYSFASDAVVYNIKLDKNKLVAEIVKVSDVLSGKEAKFNPVTGYYSDKTTVVVKTAKNNANQITNLFVTGFGASTSVDYAIVDSYYTADGKNYVKFVNNDTAYKVTSSLTDGTDPVSFNDVKALKGEIVSFTADGSTLSTIKSVDTSSKETVETINDTLVTTNGGQYYTTSKTVYIVNDEDGNAFGTVEDLEKDAEVVVEANADDELKVVIIFK